MLWFANTVKSHIWHAKIRRSQPTATSSDLATIFSHLAITCPPENTKLYLVSIFLPLFFQKKKLFNCSWHTPPPSLSIYRILWLQFSATQPPRWWRHASWPNILNTLNWVLPQVITCGKPPLTSARQVQCNLLGVMGCQRPLWGWWQTWTSEWKETGAKMYHVGKNIKYIMKRPQKLGYRSPNKHIKVDSDGSFVNLCFSYCFNYSHLASFLWHQLITK